MLTDPIGDMLTRIRNGAQAGHRETACPTSRLKLAVARVLSDEGFLGAPRVEAREGKPVLVVGLRYRDDGSPLIDGIRRVSKPGRRVYVGLTEKAGQALSAHIHVEPLSKIRRTGVAILSTPKGVMSDRAAREASVGGEVLCEVW